jgi:hypothetical protein
VDGIVVNQPLGGEVNATMPRHRHKTLQGAIEWP